VIDNKWGRYLSKEANELYDWTKIIMVFWLPALKIAKPSNGVVATFLPLGFAMAAALSRAQDCLVISTSVSRDHLQNFQTKYV